MARDIVHVAVAVIVNDSNQVLIAKRHNHVHQGGLWEFPGGKIEANETVDQALAREIKEELNIDIHHPKSLIKIKHHYSDKSVLLDVWLIKAYTGEPVGLEGQSIKWANISQLSAKEFPQANKAIIAAMQFPEFYMITGRFNSKKDFKIKLNHSLSQGNRIVQLRCKDVQDTSDYLDLANIARSICDEYHAKLLLNTSVDDFNQSSADGLHLNSHAVFQYKVRPVPDEKILSVSCHNEEEISQAKLLKADIILLSPVKETSSHPGVKGIGWKKFSSLIQDSNCPVYALGGMSVSDIEMSKKSGAQGVAAISSLWSNEK